MPLVRFAVKNEYGLGVEELYKDAVESEDPKAVLDGVAVAGLVGVLRQLGDLAQFAAEVFHGLQEQVASTSSRSRKLVNRVQRIEASLPSLEKAILSQTDHLRFAYTPGSERHAYIRTERNLFVCDDLPHFVMDSYEESKEPPRLQLLDRFDSGGPGSCLKRYSDPAFFKRASTCSEVSISEKSQRERKVRKIKKRRSWQRSGNFPKSAPTLNGSSRMQFSSTGHGQSSPSHTGSTFDMTFKSDLGDQSDSRGSKDGMDFIECDSHPTISTQPDETKNKGFSSLATHAKVNTSRSTYPDEQPAIDSDDKPCSHAVETTVPRFSSATWDELLETVEPTKADYENEDTQQVLANNTSIHELEFELVNGEGANQVYKLSEQRSNPSFEANVWDMRRTSSGNFMEPTGMNDRVGEGDFSKKKIDLPKHHLEPHLKSCTPVADLSIDEKLPESAIKSNSISDRVYRRQGTDEAENLLKADFDIAKRELEMIDSEHVSAVDAFTEGDSNVRAIDWNLQESETINAEHVSQVDSFCEGGNNVKVIEWNEQDLETVKPEHIDEGDVYSEGGNNMKVVEWTHPELDTITAEHGSASAMDNFSEDGNNTKLIKWNHWELEEQNAENFSQVDTFTEGGNSVQVIEWNQFDDIDSGTENFVDALNTIESESESDFETEMKKEVLTIGFKDELGENVTNGQTLKVTSHYYDHKGGGLENIERSTSSVSSANTWSPDRTWSAHDKPESTLGMKMEVATCLSEEQSVQTSQPAPLFNIPQGLENLERSTTSVSSANTLSPDRSWSAHDKPESTADQKMYVATCLSEEQFVQTNGSAALSNVKGLENLERSTSSVSSANTMSPDRNWSAHDKPESTAGQKMDVPPCLTEEHSVENNQSAILSDLPQGLENLERSISSVSSASTLSPDHTKSACDKPESTAGQKINVPTCLSDEQAVQINQSDTFSNVPQGLGKLERSTSSVSSATSLSPDRAWSSLDKPDSVAGRNMDVVSCLSEEQSVKISKSDIQCNVSQSFDFCATDPAVNVEPAVCEMPKSGSDAGGDRRIICGPHMEVSAGSSTSDPIALWTNGTLFGLAPSKPVVFMPNAVESTPASNGEKVGQSTLDAMQKADPGGRLSSAINKSEHGGKLGNYGEDVSSSKQLSHQRLKKTHDTSAGHDKGIINHPVIHDQSNGDALPLESKFQIGSNVKNASSEVPGASEDRSSLLSMLSRGLLKNGLRKSGSLGYYETRESSSPSKVIEFDNRCQDAALHSVSESNLKGKLNSPVNSPPPSPPLEHMKISFQPVDGFDTSRLKLKYPEGVDHYENTLDAFPTFQLVPESTKLQHDIGSDSDDDTFCQSYAYMSDDSHSHLSDSNSEQWEFGDSTESNNHTLYNGLHRISSADSASVSPQLEEAEHGNMHFGSASVSNAHLLSHSSFGLPILDANNPFGCQEMKLCLNPPIDSSHLQEPTHEPPLPPMQWRVSRLLFDEVEDNQDQESVSLGQSFVPKLSNSAITHPAKVDSAKLMNTTQESATVTKPKKVEDQKFGLEQPYHAEKDKVLDDKGDFLHQIRTKSFNLKRAEPTRSMYTPTPATSNKITAILQKANAIRQAVGSDDGEDDSWSDT
ncbi:protein SCAR3-like isoform X1 [Chenopodium quinoa]|uniref:protein SCAR3-like isoform X1 n=2 Tax=Chenopodium quinoa TaxID=63459 RepID=UPI000B784C7B|nr:protein SCAR3-like isoform X1 [Chenopodium quinoa]